MIRRAVSALGALALAAACASPAGPGRVTGSLAYRERIALPEGAVVRVMLVDISLIDAPERVLTEREIRLAGQVPIAFALDVPPGQIERERRYGVRATIAGPDGRPLWITAAWLGNPDHGVILAGYIGSLFMAGGYLAIGGCMSALTRNQVIAFIVGVLVCFLFTVSGAPIVLGFFTGWAPQVLIDSVASFSFLAHFNAITDGVVDLRDAIYFGSLIALWLYATVVAVEMKKSA